MPSKKPDNDKVARHLDQIADLLEAQQANPFRVRPYRKGAESLRNAREPVATLLEKGEDALKKSLPGVGKSLARVIEEYVTTGRSSQFDRLRGVFSPEDVFKKVPGIGTEMAHRIVKKLDVDSLEDLELAVNNGRLQKVEGFEYYEFKKEK